MTRHPIPDWPQAACRDSALDWTPTSEAPAVVNPLKAICATCPVSVLCAAVALADPATYGVWGGTTYGERARMRRRPLTLRGSAR